MLDIVLYEPEIPANAGNVIRLCANTGARLHLVRPFGFSLHDRQLRRAGLDYHALARVVQHESWPACRAQLGGRRCLALSTRGTRRYDEVSYGEGAVLVFGPETRGLPAEVLTEFEPECRVRLPMRAGARSINLSNAVAIIVYEAWRQLGFRGGS